MCTRFCIWIVTRNWRKAFVGVGLTYLFVLIGAVGVNLINIARLRVPAVLGYALVYASYAATAVTWVRLQGRRRGAELER